MAVLERGAGVIHTRVIACNLPHVGASASNCLAHELEELVRLLLVWLLPSTLWVASFHAFTIPPVASSLTC